MKIRRRLKAAPFSVIMSLVASIEGNDCVLAIAPPIERLV